MDKDTRPGYDPDRIPPSVFSATMTPKQEWSIQSNESLFSIHMGDQSFSKMYKSGELCNFEYTPPSPYITNYNIDVGTKEINVETGPKYANQDELTKNAYPNPQQQVPVSPTKSYRSDTSNNSTASFAFPTFQEYQQDQRTQLNMSHVETEVSRPDSRPALYPGDPKHGGGPGGGGPGGWLSCLSCFSVKT